MGKREEKKIEGELVLFSRGMCKGGKVERGRGGASTRGRQEGDIHRHTRTHEMIVDLGCRDAGWA